MPMRDGLEPHPTVLQRYTHLVQTGAVTRDAEQERIARALDRLIDSIIARRLATKSSALGWLFARKRETKERIKGLYVYGGVGRGKTMLMDMFYDLLPVRRKRRVHFNDFMADVHDRIAKHRQARKEGTVKEDDPIPPVARALAEQAWVLCFDEFSVTDIADAMILSRLFSALFAEGVVLVATSNVAPENLYRDGLNRGLFLPFIDTLSRNAEIMTLDGPTDYRLEKMNRLSVYLTPISPASDKRMDEMWQSVTAGQPSEPADLTVKTRKVQIPLASGSSARFDFVDLCEKPLAAREYLAITDRYDTIFIDHVPVLNPTLRNATKRFIVLIDILYDRKARAVISADVSPDRLYAGRPGTTEAFEFDRTVSRLIEMQSKEWLEAFEQRKSLKSAAQ
ncbi:MULTISPECIES: cell division protein ZapE [Mesorhizobium]|uniref:Cell division protein ZapE n=1 Tax=Mesorhizobium denitrificans TaxID=2294114 RepID=A0A371XGT5_9HYPH|nr:MULTISPECIES: cell division protein ZapE [Mesorhizobium]RFC68403.1 cell division protein ZapE [Mesorhizobium denitrificans]